MQVQRESLGGDCGIPDPMDFIEVHGVSAHRWGSSVYVIIIPSFLMAWEFFHTDSTPMGIVESTVKMVKWLFKQRSDPYVYIALLIIIL